MAPPLDQHTVQRLAYVRFLFREGVEQSKQPPPLCSRAITSFHDAVENYLGTIVQHLNIDVNKAPEFIGYWALIKTEFELPKKDLMRRLNDARVALKHNGTFPSEHQIEQAHRTVEDFFITVTPKVFGVDLDSIDMVDLLTQPAVKQYLREAQTHADVGDYAHAMAGLSLAFDALINHYRRDDGWSTRWSAFNFGERLGPLDEPRVRMHDKNSRLQKLSDFTELAQETLTVISLGIDYANKARFRILTPDVNAYGNGSTRYTVTKSLAETTPDDYDWARHFVIESGMRASRADDLQTLKRNRSEVDRSATRPLRQREWTGPADAQKTETVSAGEAV
ncbi:hypothetical protein [Streptomyces sp. 3214.6]|uniref:hypothetical protein n=1 Tax=Streptomyces sp. 3214.6 TaxID=1882757 RepID=UPI00090BB5FA|nr:hypothetical protein [Streptomyces sp. 3214.6]SHI67881.1 hypothetical protein SAMN05444521_8215 [Streptomyces sp. 3214.6]